jgi:hypothetical protein
MENTVTVTFTTEQYNWVKAIANDTWKDACEWVFQTKDDGSEAHARRAEYNKSIREISRQVLDIKAGS